MYFVLISTFLLFTLLSGYSGYQGDYLYSVVFGVFSLITLIVMIRRYRSKSNEKPGDSTSTPLDCIDCAFVPDCMPKGVKRHFDCDGGDCGALDCGGLDCLP